MEEMFKVVDNKTGQRIFSIVQAHPEEDYVLFFPDGRTKQMKGKVARFDPDFNRAFTTEATVFEGRMSFESLARFLPEGSVYTKEKENDYINAIQEADWISIESVAVYMPFEIEKIIRFAIFENNLKIVTHYSYVHDFSPLHFFGLRVQELRELTDMFFIADGICTTPVVEVKTKL
jgi:hypothetical protein